MAKKTITLHMYELTEEWRLAAQKHCVDEYDMRNSVSLMEGRAWIGSCEVEIDFPEVDTRKMQIDQLEKQVQEERAKSQSRINLLLDRISKLQAIGHEVAE